MTWWFTGLDVLKGERSAKYHPALWNVLFTKSSHWLYPFNWRMRINLNFDQDAKFSVQADPLTAKPSGHTFFTSRVFFAFFLFCSTYWVKPSIICYFNSHSHQIPFFVLCPQRDLPSDAYTMCVSAFPLQANRSETNLRIGQSIHLLNLEYKFKLLDSQLFTVGLKADWGLFECCVTKFPAWPLHCLAIKDYRDGQSHKTNTDNIHQLFDPP